MLFAGPLNQESSFGSTWSPTFLSDGHVNVLASMVGTNELLDIAGSFRASPLADPQVSDLGSNHVFVLAARHEVRSPGQRR